MAGQLNGIQFGLVALVCIGSISLLETVQAQTQASKKKPAAPVSPAVAKPPATNTAATNQTAASPTRLVQDYYNMLASAKSPTPLLKFYSAKLRGEQEQTMRQVTPARVAKFMQYLRFGLLKKVRVTSESATGDTGLVYVEATTTDPMGTPPVQKDSSVKAIMQKYGVYFLVKENGQWKIDAENWDDEPLAANLTNPNKWDAWADEAVKTEAPQTPAQGKFEGSTFTPAECTLSSDQFFGGTWLKFKAVTPAKGEPDTISIGLLDDKGSVEDKTFEVSNNKMSWNKTKMFNIIFTSNKYDGETKTRAGVGICGMKLKFGKATKEGIPGTIVLRMKYQPETSLAGTFVAKQK